MTAQKVSAGTSLVDAAYREIRQRILDNVWPPGHRALEQEVALALGMSRTPVREALMRLAAEGLVEVIPRHGMRVLPVSPATTCARSTRSSPRSSAWPPNCWRSAGPLRRTETRWSTPPRRWTGRCKADDLDAWAAADERFHAHLVELAGNRQLQATVLNYWDRCAPRTHVHAAPAAQAGELDPGTHADGGALRAGDAEGAVRVSRGRTANAPISNWWRSSSVTSWRRCERTMSLQTPTPSPCCRVTASAAKSRPRRCSAARGGRAHRPRFDTVTTPPARSTTWTAAWPCPRPRSGLPRGRCHPVRRDGPAACAWRRRHRDHSAARPALRARSLCGRATDPQLPGLPGPLADSRAAQIDLVLVRESTEGLFHARGRGRIEATDAQAAYDTMKITRAGTARVCDFALRLARQRKARGPARACHQRRQGQRLRLDGLLAPGVRRACRAFPDVHHGTRLRRRDGAEPGDEALGLRRAGHREHVRRHPVGPDRRAGRRHGHGALGRHRRPPRAVPAGARHRARHRGPGHRQSHGHAAVGWP
jgi:DNA-binding GntR family transcriptional regulator